VIFCMPFRLQKTNPSPGVRPRAATACAPRRSAAIVRLIAGQRSTFSSSRGFVALGITRNPRDIVMIGSGHRAGYPNQFTAMGRRPQGEDLGSGVLRIAVQIDEDIDAVCLIFSAALASSRS